jgi:hypothetical protein
MMLTKTEVRMDAPDPRDCRVTSTPQSRHIEHIESPPLGMVGQNAKDAVEDYLPIPEIAKILQLPPSFLPPSDELAGASVGLDRLREGVTPASPVWLRTEVAHATDNGRPSQLAHNNTSWSMATLSTCKCTGVSLLVNEDQDNIMRVYRKIVHNETKVRLLCCTMPKELLQPETAKPVLLFYSFDFVERGSSLWFAQQNFTSTGSYEILPASKRCVSQVRLITLRVCLID